MAIALRKYRTPFTRRTTTPAPAVACASVALALCIASVTGDEKADASLTTARSEYSALLAARDAWIARLKTKIAADEAIEPARDFTVCLWPGIAVADEARSLKDGVESRIESGLQISLPRRGGKWGGGAAVSPSYNRGRHQADAAGLNANQTALQGSVLVVINPDFLIQKNFKPLLLPPDGKPKRMVYRVDARIDGDRLEGTFEGDGDLGAQKGVVSGSVALAAAAAAFDADAGDKAAPSDPVQEASFMAERGVVAYQRARAAALACTHYPAAISNAVDLTRTPAPRLDPSTTNDPAAAIEGVRDFLSQMRRLLEASFHAKTPASYVEETDPVEDPFFGPFFADEALPTNAAGALTMPADVGQDGPQKWQHPGQWRLLAAFPPDERLDLATPDLPPLVPSTHFAYSAEPERMGADYKAPKSGLLSWKPERVPFRFVAPPGQAFFHGAELVDSRSAAVSSVGVHGAARARWFAATEIDSPENVTLYASAEAQAFGEFWVNDRLVWKRKTMREVRRSGVLSLDAKEDPVLFRVPFVKGTNRLLMVCQSEGKYSWFGLTLCTRGKPMTAAQRQTMRVAQSAAATNLPPDPRRGRRGDWSGCFAQADPPLAWDVKEGINLLWRTELPDYSAAHPVVTESRVFVNSEPHVLHCLDKNTGRILWSRECHAFEFLPKEQQAEAMKAWREYRGAKDSADTGKLRATLAELELEKKDKEDAGLLDDATRNELDARILETKKSIEAAGGKSADYNRWRGQAGIGDPGWSNNYGYTYPSPVTDGKKVWAKFGTGVAACYDMDGNRQWMVRTGFSGGGQLPSPVLLDGKMILQGALDERSPLGRKELARIRAAADTPVFFGRMLMALDAQTGEMAWLRPVPAVGGYSCESGIVPVRVSDGRRVREIVAIGTGLLVDPRDGRLLSSVIGVGADCWHADPLVVGNRVYWYRGATIAAAEVWLEEDGSVGAKIVFRSQGGCAWPGAAYVDGYVFSHRGYQPPNGRAPVPWICLNSYDARTGKTAGSLVPAMRDGGLCYSAPASAGPYAVIVGSGPGPHAWAIDMNSSARIGFAVAGPRPFMVSEGELLEPMVASPVFEGNRMYVRTYKSAMCIAVTNEAGRRFALETKARTLLGNIPERPILSEVIDLPAAADYVPPAGVPTQDFYSLSPAELRIKAGNDAAGMPRKVLLQTAPTNWLMAGPLPLVKGDDPLRGLGGVSNARPDLATTLSHGGTNFPFASAPTNVVQGSAQWGKNYFGYRQFGANCRFDIGVACRKKNHSVLFFYTVLRSAEKAVRVVQFAGGNRMSCWIAGREVTTGRRIRFGKGYYPVLVKVEMERIPPFATEIVGEFRLKDTADPLDDYVTWKSEIAFYRDRLEQTIRELPDAPEATTARNFLRILDSEGNRTNPAK